MTRIARLLVFAGAFGVTLAACGDSTGTTPQAGESVLPDSAEAMGWGITVTLTNNGVAKGELIADSTLHYDSNNRLELRRFTVNFFNALGEKDGVLTAKEGGNVVVVREDGKRLETPQLVYDELRNQMFSDSSFVLNEPPKRQITGIGFESDPQLTKFRVMKNFKGVAPVKVETP
jgi:LPS export ABC transporter protein LptC